MEKAGGSAVVDATFDIEASSSLKGAKTSSPKAEKPGEEKNAAPKAEKKAPKKEEVKAEAPKKAASKKTSKGDDLKKIEGIGPKIAELLANAGVDTFAKLADAKVEDLSNILSEAGSRYASHNPATWPEQSALASAGKWDELKELQDKLNGGRPE
ncbi:DUF4332 domain-containing protein [Jiulongibacter sp. NS-SX5]|uniref:DUF4332 domain-containing protein n=1 Tax=Jiulongibacter sp. NS-SX5 TaxID=3463854 RepID=UPI004057D93D